MMQRRPLLWLVLVVFLLLIVAVPRVESAQPAQVPGTCSAWTQVNDGAFGLPGDPYMPQPYMGQESYEVLVYNDQLYLGMEAGHLGARLWRSRAGVTQPTSQSDWEEVAASDDGLPFGSTFVAQHDHIDSLAAFDGALYVSTASNDRNRGTPVYRSVSGAAESWQLVNMAGFGDVHNTNFKALTRFQGHLCGGTQNGTNGAQVWCSPDGTTWTQRNESGFGDLANVGIWSMTVFRGALYVGVNYNNGVFTLARLYRTTDLSAAPTWERVYEGPLGSRLVDILGSLDGFLYIGTRSKSGIRILRSASGAAETWTQVNMAGMDGTRDNAYTVTDGATVYQDALYVAVLNDASGVQVWRTHGRMQSDGPTVDWQRIGAPGLGDPDNLLARLVVFHDRLYAWTSNYTSGHQVRQTACVPFPRLYLPVVTR